MIKTFYKNRFAIPSIDGNVVKWFDNTNKTYGKPHLGIDISWWTDGYEHSNILACQDGKVVDKSTKADKTVGHYIVLQHDYDDGTHAWSTYIHLYNAPKLNVGATVKMNDVIGQKGNTGASNGTHLHLYLTKPTTLAYTWNNMRNNTVNPYPLLYKSKGAKYVYLGSHLVSKGYLEDLSQPVDYPKPVERNEKVKQVEVIMHVLRIRNGAGTNFDAYDEFCKPGIYDILEEKRDTAGTYLWYKIGEGFWIASGGVRTKDLLPELSVEEQLRNENAELKEINAQLQAQIDILKVKIVGLEGSLGEKVKVLEKINELSK